MKQSDKQGEKNKIGSWGEQIAVNYLKKKKFRILDLNYLKKWGEIDIVARETFKNKEITHFVEVKTVSYETKELLNYSVLQGNWKPEDNVSPRKIQKMNRAIESWLSEYECNADWQIDVVAVRIVPREKYATVKYIPNVIIG